MPTPEVCSDFVKSVENCGPGCLHRSSVVGSLICQTAPLYHRNCPLPPDLQVFHDVDADGDDAAAAEPTGWLWSSHCLSWGPLPQQLASMCVFLISVGCWLLGSWILGLFGTFCMACRHQNEFFTCVKLCTKAFCAFIRVPETLTAAIWNIFRFFLASFQLSFFGVSLLMFIGDPDMVSEQCCDFVLGEGLMSGMCATVLAFFLRRIQRFARARVRAIAHVARIDARRGAAALRTSNILDGGCTNMIMCPLANKLEMDVGVSPDTVKLSIAGGNKIDADYLPNSEEVFFNGEEVTENLISQHRVCSFGKRIAFSWTDSGEAGAEVSTCLVPSTPEAREMLKSLSNHSEAIFGTHEQNTTYLSDAATSTLRTEAAEGLREAKRSVRTAGSKLCRVGGNEFSLHARVVATEHPSELVFGVRDSDFDSAVSSCPELLGLTQLDLRVIHEQLYDLWKRTQRPKSFLKSIRSSTLLGDLLLSSSHVSDLLEDDEEVHRDEVGIVGLRGKVNQQRVPRSRSHPGPERIPVKQHSDWLQINSKIAPSIFHFYCLDGSTVQSENHMLDDMSEVVLRSHISCDTGLVVAMHENHMIDFELPERTKQVFCDVITFPEGLNKQKYGFVFSLYNGSTHTTICFPALRNDESTFMEKFNWMLFHFRLYSERCFFLTIEGEGFLGLRSLERCAAVGALMRPCIPKVSPWQEVFCRDVLRRLREVLFLKNLPVALWPEALLILNEVRLSNAGLARVSEIPTNTMLQMFGTLSSAKIPDKASKLEPQGTDCLVLGPVSSRWGVKVMFSRDNQNEQEGYTLSHTDFRGLIGTGELVFKTERDGLTLRKMIHPSLVSSTSQEKQIPPRKIGCERCRRDAGKGGQHGRGRPPAHTFADDCRKMVVTVIPKEIPEFYIEVPSQDLKIVEVSEVESAEVAPRAARVKTVFDSLEPCKSFHVDAESAMNLQSVSRTIQARQALVEFFKKEDLDELRDGVSPEVMGAMSNSMQANIRAELARKVRDIEGRNKSPHHVQETRCYAVAYKLKDVLKECDDPKLKELWVNGLDVELRALLDRNVLRLIHVDEVTEDDELLPSLCVFTMKSDGRRKCRITACGNFAVDNGDPAQNFSETVQFFNANALLRLSLTHGWSAAFCDVSEAFTQSVKGASEGPRRVLRLPTVLKHLWSRVLLENGHNPQDFEKLRLAVLESIYGERDAPRVWGATFSKWIQGKESQSKIPTDQLETMGFVELKTDSRVYVKVRNGVLTLVFAYVDDIICVSEDLAEVEGFFASLKRRFKCTNVSYLNGKTRHTDVATAPVFLTDQYYFEEDKSGKLFCCVDQQLWIEGAFSRLKEKGLWDGASTCASLNARHFCEDWLFEEVDSNPLLTPQELTKLRSGVNSLSYLAAHTRPELAAALGILARGQTPKGRRRFLDSLKFLLAYAWTHRQRRVRFECRRHPIKLSDVTVVCDADASMGTVAQAFARHGYIISLLVRFADGESFQVPIAWKSGLQTTISISSTESEIVCASWATRNFLPIQYLLEEIKQLFFFCLCTPCLYQDNEAAMSCAAGGTMRRLRHLTLHQLFVRYMAQDGKIRVLPKRTKEMIADLLTKVLGDERARFLLGLIGIHSSRLEGAR